MAAAAVLEVQMLVCLYVHMSDLLQSPGLRDLLFYLFQRHRTHQELSSPCWWRVGRVRSSYHIRVSLGVQCWGWLTGRWYPETQDHTINQSLISDTPGSPDVRDFSEREKQYQIIVKNRSLMQLIALIRLNIATDCLQHCSALHSDLNAACFVLEWSIWNDWKPSTQSFFYCSNSIPTHLYLIHVIKKDLIEKDLAGNSFVNLIHFKQKVDDIPASWWNTYQLRFFPTFINIIRNRNCLVEEYSAGL